MGVHSQLSRDEIISWLRERQNHWMTPNYNRAAAMLEAEAAENETLREWYLSSQAEIARLKAEVERLTEGRELMGRLWAKEKDRADTARNDALEEAASVCDSKSGTPMDVKEPEYYTALGYELAAEDIRALRRPTP